MRNATRLYAWLLDDDASDNGGKLSVVLQVSKYVPAKQVSFDPQKNVIVGWEDEVMTLEGLREDRTYSLLLRAVDPHLMGEVPPFVFCSQKSSRPLSVQARYQFLPVRHKARISGVNGLDCMFLSHAKDDAGGLVDIAIEDPDDLSRRARKSE